MKAISLFVCFCIIFVCVFISGCDEILPQDISADVSSESAGTPEPESGGTPEPESESAGTPEPESDSITPAQFTGSMIPAYEDLIKTPVDFSLSVNDLICGETADVTRGSVRAGKKLTLQVKVRKDTSVFAGGSVIFKLFGKTLDIVPFSIKASEQYITVKCYYVLPFNADLSNSQNSLFMFEALVEPDTLCSDTNTANNSAGKNIVFGSSDFTANNPPADATIASLKIIGDIGENIAVPGRPLTLKVLLGGSSGNTRVYFYVNDDFIGNQACYISRSSGLSVCSSIYYVPYNCTGFLDVRVILENGVQAAMTVPVETYDFQLKNNSISWDYSSTGSNAGSHINFICKIYKDSDISFGYAEGLRTIFVVNGVQSNPIKADTNSGMSPYMGELVYSYTIPENCSWPLNIKVFADSGGLFSETEEGNNTAEISVPKSAPNNGSPGLSISSGDMWFYPNELIPGKTVQFFAAVFNHSSQPIVSTRVCFFVNGIQLDPSNDLYNGGIGGGQYHVFQEKWTVPETLTGDPVYTLTVIPGNSLAGEDASDNTASLTYQTALPDFTISSIKTHSANGDTIFNGESVDLVATVYNHGSAPAPQVIVDFRIGGVVANSRPVNLPAYGAVEIRLPVSIPKVEDQTPASPDITGLTGYIYPGLGSGSVNLDAVTDPGNLIGESNENNNMSGESVLNVATANQKGAVYVRVRDEDINNVQGAAVTITASEKTASAITDSYGSCSFHNVPFGVYTVSADADNYNSILNLEEYLYESNRCDHADIYLNDNSYVTGTVTYSGSLLAEVSVILQEPYIKVKTNADGEYNLEVPPGTYTIKFIKAGYERITESVTVPVLSSAVKNAAMNTTTTAYISGYIYGTEGELLSGMNVTAFRANGSDLVTAVTDSEGFYNLDVPLYAAYTEDIGIRVTGQGLSKVQGLFLYQGLEHNGDLSFEPVSSGTGEILSSIEGRVTPWTECASMPGTSFNPDYEVEVIYGAFFLDTYIMVTDSVITHLEIDITPDFWYYGSVSSSWSPTELLEINNEFAASALEVACFILPLDIPIEAEFHSSDYTKTWIKKISILSDGIEVFQKYPDKANDCAYSPGIAVNWDNCRIKYYLTTVSAENSANPAAGYGCDHVLIEWDPKEKEFTKIGNFTPNGWNENGGHQNFSDQG